VRNKQAEHKINLLLDKLETIRKERGYSHEKLANLSGVHRSTISLLESKKRIPTVLTCLKICDALDVAFDEVIRDL
jgi:DNA-binding XRE family transcriptional regulator